MKAEMPTSRPLQKESLMAQSQMSREEEMRFAERSMEWYGWGSPIGLGVMIVALAMAAVLLRIAIYGF